MRDGLDDKYREAAEEFAHRVGAALGDQVDSIVLYGSVARGEARADSDIDVLVLVPEKGDIAERVDRILDEDRRERGFQSLISPVFVDRDQFRDRIENGYPFIGAVFEDGVVLYDNGSFSRVRGSLMTPSPEYVHRQLESAEEALSDAEYNLGGRRLRTAGSRAYYAVFHSALAALAAVNAPMPRSHRGTRIQFEEQIIGTGHLDNHFGVILRDAQKLRRESDYEVEVEVSLSHAETAVREAREFVEAVKGLISNIGEDKTS